MRIIDILQSKIYLEKTKVKPFSINPYVITIKNFQNYTLDESQVKRWIAPYVEKIDQISIVDRNNDVIFKDKRFTQALEPSVYVFCQTRGNINFFPKITVFINGRPLQATIEIEPLIFQEYSNPTYDGSKEAVEFLNFLKTKRLVNLNEKIECLEKVEEIVRKTIETMYPDPSKRPLFSKNACCMDFCPETERLKKILNGQLSPFEKPDTYPNLTCDPQALIIKDYTRSAADQNLPLFYEVRTVGSLTLLMRHLVGNVFSLPCALTYEWFIFIYDCMRSMRKELSQLSSYDIDSIKILEKMVRFHIFCIPFTKKIFNELINNDNSLGLQHSLGLLKEFVLNFCKHHQLSEIKHLAEIISYQILLNMNNPHDFLWIYMNSALFEDIQIEKCLKIRQAYLERNYYKFFKYLGKAGILHAACLFSCVLKFRVKCLSMMTNIYRSPTKNILRFSTDVFVRHLGITDEDQFTDFLAKINAYQQGDSVCIDKTHRIQIDFKISSLPEEPLIIKKWTTSLSLIINPGFKHEKLELPKVSKSFDQYGCFVGTQFDTLLNKRPICSTLEVPQTKDSIIPANTAPSVAYSASFFNPSPFMGNQNYRFTNYRQPLSFPASTPVLPFITPTQQVPQFPSFSLPRPEIFQPPPSNEFMRMPSMPVNFTHIGPVIFENMADQVLDVVVKEAVIGIGREVINEAANRQREFVRNRVYNALREYYLHKYLTRWRKLARDSYYGIPTSTLNNTLGQMRESTESSYINQFSNTLRRHISHDMDTSFWWEYYFSSPSDDIFEPCFKNIDSSTQNIKFLKILVVFPDTILDKKLSFSQTYDSLLLVIWCKIFLYNLNLKVDDFKNLVFDHRRMIIQRNNIRICLVSSVYRNLKGGNSLNVKSIYGCNAVLLINSPDQEYKKVLLSNITNLMFPNFYFDDICLFDRETSYSYNYSNESIDTLLKNKFLEISKHSPYSPIFHRRTLWDIVKSDMFYSIISVIHQFSSVLYFPDRINQTTKNTLKSINTYFQILCEYFSSKLFYLPIPISEMDHCYGVPEENWNDRKQIKKAITILGYLIFPKKFIELSFNYFPSACKALDDYITKYYSKVPNFPNYVVAGILEKCHETCISKIHNKYVITIGNLVLTLLDSSMNYLSQVPNEGLNISVWSFCFNFPVTFPSFQNLLNIIDSIKSQNSQFNISPDRLSQISSHIDTMNSSISRIEDRVKNRRARIVQDSIHEETHELI